MAILQAPRQILTPHMGEHHLDARSKASGFAIPFPAISEPNREQPRISQRFLQCSRRGHAETSPTRPAISSRENVAK
jgi:hypothetical protein